MTKKVRYGILSLVGVSLVILAFAFLKFFPFNILLALPGGWMWGRYMPSFCDALRE